MLAFSDNNIAQWVHHIHAIAFSGFQWLSMPFNQHFDANLCRIAQWVSALKLLDDFFFFFNSLLTLQTSDRYTEFHESPRFKHRKTKYIQNILNI